MNQNPKPNHSCACCKATATVALAHAGAVTFRIAVCPFTQTDSGQHNPLTLTHGECHETLRLA